MCTVFVTKNAAALGRLRKLWVSIKLSGGLHTLVFGFGDGVLWRWRPAARLRHMNDGCVLHQNRGAVARASIHLPALDVNLTAGLSSP